MILNRKKLASILEGHEDKRHTPYLCTAGKLTIGIGRNLEGRGLSDDEIAYLLNNDIEAVEIDLMGIFPNFIEFSEERQLALADMRFQLGYGGFRGFKEMIKAIKVDDWDKASYECLNSVYAVKTPTRAAWVASQLKGD